MNSRGQQHNHKAALKLKTRIAAQLKRAAGKGLEAAIRFLAARIKETLNVPAPRAAIRGPAAGKKLGPIIGYRATTRAIPGAPPRKVTGRLQQSTTHKMLTPTIGIVGNYARSDPGQGKVAGFNYPRWHELGKTDSWGGGEHQFIKPTVDKYRKELETITRIAVRTELRVR